MQCARRQRNDVSFIASGTFHAIHGYTTESIPRAEKLAAIPAVVDPRFNAKLEVSVIAALREQVAGPSHELAILDLPVRLFIGMRLPAGEIFAVEELDPVAGSIADRARTTGDRRGRIVR